MSKLKNYPAIAGAINAKPQAEAFTNRLITFPLTIAEANHCRNELAWNLEELLPGESAGERFPGGFAYNRECRGKHFNWRHVASNGTGNQGFLAPVHAKTELAREINKLSRDLMAARGEVIA